MSDLTAADAREINQYLAATCEAVERWLPGPEWRPGWQSEAAGELANAELGPAGPWGEAPVRAAYLAAALYLAAVLECLRAMGDCVTAETTAYVPSTLARAAMEAGWHAWWLLEPGIGARRRAARFLLIRCSGARYLARAVDSTDPGAGSLYGETPEMVTAVAAGHGLDCGYRKSPRYGNRKVWSCADDELPPYTERGAMFEGATAMRAAYGIYSAAAHAEWHAVIAGWRQVDASGDMPALLVSRPDRVAVWAAVIASAGFACVPARRALELLGLRSERLSEWRRWAAATSQLEQKMGLPADWGG